MFKMNRPVVTVAVALALVLSPALHAAEAPSRDTGVGKEIAAQGNLALEAIRAELRTALRTALRPVLPAPAARVVKASLPAGATLAVGPTVRCDQ